MKKGRFTYILVIAVTFPIIIGILVASFCSTVVSLNLEKSIVLNNGWIFNWEDSDKKISVKVPETIPGGKENKILHLQNSLPSEELNNACLFLRTTQQYIKIYVNNSLIYEYNQNPGNMGKAPGGTYHFVNLPPDYPGAGIDIYLSSPFKQFSGIINDIYLGNSISHILYVLKSHSLDFIISAVVLTVGIILIVFFFSLCLYRSKYMNILHLGLFSVFSGLWMVAESRIIELFIQNPILIMNMAFISQFLMPIPILAFINSTYQPKNNSVIRLFIWIFTGFSVIASFFHLLHVAEFMSLLTCFHILVFLCILVLLALSMSEFLSGNKSIKLFFFGCIMLCIFVLTDIIRYYFFNSSIAQSFFQYGMLIFIFVTIISLAQGIILARDQKISNEILMSLAYTDILTGFKNRTCFEKRISELNKNLDSYSSIHFIILDINGLKAVNDNFGHKEGDRLIIEGAKLIHETLGILGELFRIGGDEFIIIITDMESYFINIEIETLNKRLDDYNRSRFDLKISIAYGMDSYNKDIDKDLHSVFVRADRAMYACKEKQKLISVPR